MPTLSEIIALAVGDTIVKSDGVRYAVQGDATVAAVEKPRKVQSTRLLKACCTSCGYTVRVTKRWADKGLPVCPTCTTYETLGHNEQVVVLRHLQTLTLETPAAEGDNNA